MRRRDESQNVFAFGQYLLYPCNQPVEAPVWQLGPAPVAAYLSVLAVYALEIAMDEEHVADAFFPAYDGFLSIVVAYEGYPHFIGAVAETRFTLCPVRPALSGTQTAVAQCLTFFVGIGYVGVHVGFLYKDSKTGSFDKVSSPSESKKTQSNSDKMISEKIFFFSEDNLAEFDFTVKEQISL